jgi:acetylornithine deacetylase
VVRVERRTLPGETPEQALAQVDAACATVKATRPTFDATIAVDTYRAPSDVATDATIVTSLVAATAATGTSPVDGVSYWSDASLLNAAGIPTVCYGPGDIALAHGAVEWIPVEEISRATSVIERFLAEWTRA